MILPKNLARFFWDAPAKSIDTKKNRAYIIARILNYGTLSHWRWLAKTYGKKQVAEMVNSSSRSSIKEPARRLARLLFR